MFPGKNGEHLTCSCLLVKVELSGNTYFFTLTEFSTSIELCLTELHRCTVANGEDDERLTESRKVLCSVGPTDEWGLMEVRVRKDTASAE